MTLAQRILLYAARFFAICAILAGFDATLAGVDLANFACFDACPYRDGSGATMFAYVTGGPSSALMMDDAKPCLALALVALLLFLAYCGLTRQGRRALIALLVALIPLIVGYVAFYHDYTQAATSLHVDSNGILLTGPIVSFVGLWYLGPELLLCLWSSALAYVQWGIGRTSRPWLTAPATH
jgi:hypothetical protein